MLSPTALPASYVQKLPHYFNQIQIAKILNETTLYPYNTTPTKGGMSGAVLTLVQLLRKRVLSCRLRHRPCFTTPNPAIGYVTQMSFTGHLEWLRWMGYI
ncbi:hypothetical protein L210DRAFT_3570477, partial [Boletus edulis BED1]